MSISATKCTFVYLWLLVALLRLGEARDVSVHSDLEGVQFPTQGSLFPTTIESNTSTKTPAHNRLQRASPSAVTSSCLAPSKPVNGQYKLDTCDDVVNCKVSKGSALEPGSRLVYSCNPGYKASGNTDVFCNTKGKWSAIPECIQVRCNALNSESTVASCTRFGKRVNCDFPMLPETRAEVACRQGYKKDTDFVTTRRTVVNCDMDGKWGPQPIRCLPVCGRTITHQQPLVYGGTPAEIGEFPWHASLFMEKTSPTGNRKLFRCGGTIIKTNLVLTAAHCVYDEITKTTEDPAKLFVITGNIFQDYDSSEHNPAIVRKTSVKNVYINCNYYGLVGNYISDIALLELQQSFEFSGILLPACLDDSDYSDRSLEPGAYGRVAGFGRTAKSNTSAVLQTITLPYIPYSECKTSNDAAQNEAFISSDKFCAGYNNGSAVCEGDSGGGLVFKKDDLWYIVGIVSVGLGVNLDNGEKTCDKYSYSLYTKVSTYMTWIQDVLFYLERNQPYPSCSPDSQTTTSNVVSTSDVEPFYCVAPPQPANGEWRLASNLCEENMNCSISEGAMLEEGSQLIYSCAPEFTTEGPTEVFCGNDGEWTSIPTCTNSSCSLTNGSSGMCTLLKNCPSIMEEDKIGRSSDEVCKSSGLEPIVCCPLATPVVETTSPPVEILGDGRGAIARQKCIEYSQYADPAKCPWSLHDNEQPEKESSTGRKWPGHMEFPHLAAIGFPLSYDPNSVSWDCGGALISEVFVLTSAACVDSKTRGNATMVRVGDVDAYSNETYTERRIIKIILHPEYKPPSEYHDIGLVRLESPIPLDGWRRPACLHTAPSVGTHAAFTTKWGYSDYALDEASTSLFKVPLPVVDLPICEARWASVTPEPEATLITGSNIIRYPIPEKKLAKGIVEDWLICAGATGKSTCQGDPGGPLVIRKVDEGKKLCMYDVIGVLSLEKICAARIPALYTRVYHYVPWIESIVWEKG